ncbi:MAG: carboxymethylenebutenolidase [Paraglaciecola psychrophila]|jgi:carboxymethylenebutenolidase
MVSFIAGEHYSPTIGGLKPLVVGKNMCDEKTVNENEAFLQGDLSRRQFAKLSAAAGVAMVLPTVANALSVTEQDVDVTTADGVADCYFVHPTSGKYPAVLIWPDILGLRPAFRAMGKRLAESGYAVLVINPFYRSARSPVVALGASFADPQTRAKVLPLARALNADTHFSDARDFIAFIDKQGAVDSDKKIGTSGYCMGGPMVVRTTAAVPDRVGAGATFHGGGLVTADEDSPHRLIAKTQAQVLHCLAANDDERDSSIKTQLRSAYEEAKLAAEIEVYAGAMHGWCPPDSSVYNEVQAERAWARMLHLFEQTLV